MARTRILGPSHTPSITRVQHGRVIKTSAATARPQPTAPRVRNGAIVIDLTSDASESEDGREGGGGRCIDEGSMTGESEGGESDEETGSEEENGDKIWDHSLGMWVNGSQDGNTDSEEQSGEEDEELPPEARLRRCQDQVELMTRQQPPSKLYIVHQFLKENAIDRDHWSQHSCPTNQVLGVFQTLDLARICLRQQRILYQRGLWLEVEQDGDDDRGWPCLYMKEMEMEVDIRITVEEYQLNKLLEKRQYTPPRPSL